MIDQSVVKVFVLLMEQENDSWVIPVHRLQSLSETTQITSQNDTFTFSEFINYEIQNKINLNVIFENLCSNFIVFDFIFSEGFHKISNESIVFIRDNQDFLQELYEAFKSQLKNPVDLINNPSNFDSFVNGMFRFGLTTELLPNLANLKEFLLLSIYIRRYRALNTNKTMGSTFEQSPDLTFEEFKTFLLLFNKFMCFKYKKFYDFHEETYLSHLFWYLFLKMVNNEFLNVDQKMKTHNSRIDENIFFQLNKVDLDMDKELSEGIMQNLELLFLLFGNHFSSVGNPHLLMDNKSLLKAKGFQLHAQWLKSYISNLGSKGDFTSFLEILTKVILVRKEGLKKEDEFKKFVQDNSYNLDVRMQTRDEEVPKLREDLGRKVKLLFSKYSVDRNIMYVMDFVFMTKDFMIVPNQYTNKQIMIIFYQANIRELTKKYKKKEDIFAAKNFYYIGMNAFVKLLVEIADNFVKGAIHLDFEEKLELLFSKIIRVGTNKVF